MNNIYELKAGQDDFKDLRVISEAKKVFNNLVRQMPHTILVWPGCTIQKQLQTAFEESNNSFEKKLTIVENPTVEENFLVIMNKDAEVLDAVEIQWEDGEANVNPEDIIA